MKILNERDGAVPADMVEVARSLAGRLMGLIGRREFPKGSALVIPGCRQVHTFFMRFPIDVAFLDAENRILCIEPGVKPNSITRYCRDASSAVEFPSGIAEEYGLRREDRIALREG